MQQQTGVGAGAGISQSPPASPLQLSSVPATGSRGWGKREGLLRLPISQKHLFRTSANVCVSGIGPIFLGQKSNHFSLFIFGVDKD